MVGLTEEFRSLHREVWEAHQKKIDAIAREWRAAEQPTLEKRNGELREEDARHSEICRGIYKKYDLETAPIRKPFGDRMDIVIAERDAAIKALKAEHGVAI